jgi:ABC-type sulfate transport system permease component
MFRSQTLLLATALVLIPLSSTVLASSDDAWDDFAKDVAAKCTNTKSR